MANPKKTLAEITEMRDGLRESADLLESNSMTRILMYVVIGVLDWVLGDGDIDLLKRIKKK